jgi:hypothetical protein
MQARPTESLKAVIDHYKVDFEVLQVAAMSGAIFWDIMSTRSRHFSDCCRCREAVKLLRFLLPPYSLIGTCNSMQNCTSCSQAEKEGVKDKSFNYFWELRYHDVREPLHYSEDGGSTALRMVDTYL